jgi:hypothetical protein
VSTVVGAVGGAGGTGTLAAGVADGAWTTGVANGVERRISGSAGASPEVRARATTPGVKVGVGFRDCAGGLNGVEKGSEGRGGGGPPA